MKIRYYVFSGHLDEGEEIMATAHRHLFILLKDSFKTFFFLVFLPIVFYLFFPQAILIAFVWLCVGLMGLLYHFIDWFFDAWLITNVGVIDIERNGLFDRTSTRVEYHMMEGLSYNIKGFWPTVLNFGDVTLDKLGTKTSVVLIGAASPKKIERLIMKFQEKFISERSIRDHHALKDMLSEMIAYHVQNQKIKTPNKKE